MEGGGGETQGAGPGEQTGEIYIMLDDGPGIKTSSPTNQSSFTFPTPDQPHRRTSATLLPHHHPFENPRQHHHQQHQTRNTSQRAGYHGSWRLQRDQRPSVFQPRPHSIPQFGRPHGSRGLQRLPAQSLPRPRCPDGPLAHPLTHPGQGALDRRSRLAHGPRRLQRHPPKRLARHDGATPPHGTRRI